MIHLPYIKGLATKAGVAQDVDARHSRGSGDGTEVRTTPLKLNDVDGRGILA
jgi:hypothetical protein